MNNLDHFHIQQLLLHEILRYPYGRDWSVQGLGMMRLYLSDEVRLHIWHSSLVVPNVTDIHEHPWDFESLVLCGEVRNHRYIGAEEGRGEAYYRDTLLCGTGNLAGDPDPVWIQPWFSDDRPSVYGPNRTYSQRFDEVHRTEFDDGTVTLVWRKFVNEDRDHASVYWKRGEQFVSAEPRPATVGEIILVCGSAIEQLTRQAGV